jgi:hypothetical protein
MAVFRNTWSNVFMAIATSRDVWPYVCNSKRDRAWCYSRARQHCSDQLSAAGRRTCAKGDGGFHNNITDHEYGLACPCSFRIHPVQQGLPLLVLYNGKRP